MTLERRTQAERSAATRAALIDAARPLFAEHGFAGVGTEAIVRAADVTRGALYHHFADKTQLFDAVLDAVEADVAERIVARVLAATDAGVVEMLMGGVAEWFDTCQDPEVQRILLVDGPSVLGWERWREICLTHVLGLAEGLLGQGMAEGTFDHQPLRPLAHVMMAVMDEAALYIVKAHDPETARRDMTAVIARLVAAL